jgi:hypothetical protein
MQHDNVDICHLCGRRAQLTREHIPPAGAFKGRPYRVRVQRGDEVIAGTGGREYQRGFHARVLCESCNNLTGAWYGEEFTRWSRWGLALLEATTAGVLEMPAFDGFPVRIAKQVVSTMIASAGADLAERRPRLRQFVLDRDACLGLNEIRLAMYVCPTSTGRSTGVAAAMREGAEPHILVEFALPPFGYVLTLDGEPFDARPVDISWFATLGYFEKRTIILPEIPFLPTHEAWPGDYRTKEEIRRDVIVSILSGQGHDDPTVEALRILESGEGPHFFAANGEDWE